MKYLRLLLAAVVLCSFSFGAQAEKIFRFGPKVGVEVNNMRLNTSVFDSDNRAGFTGGLMFEANVPLIGLCFDLSVMYVHRVNSNTATATVSADEQSLIDSDSYTSRDYIELPLNIKYRFSLPAVGNFVAPYIYTGPSFAFLTSKQAINEAFKNKSFDVSWNFGVGVQLINHLQIGASYGIGITKTVEKISSISAGTEITGRNNYWTITAAWLF